MIRIILLILTACMIVAAAVVPDIQRAMYLFVGACITLSVVILIHTWVQFR